MNKELTPLEAFREFKKILRDMQEIDGFIRITFQSDNCPFADDLDIVEQALKDYEDEKKTSYNRLLKIGELVGQINENEKSLKALEIIKNEFPLEFEEKDGMYFLRSGYTKCRIAKEEYDLLREVLKDD